MAVEQLERGANQLVVMSATARAGRLAVLVTVGLVGAWVATWSANGTSGPVVHVFYLPVMVAAARFGYWGALLTAVAAGVLAGPAMPLDVEARTPQAVENWLFRLGFFVVIGQTVAYLCGRSIVSVRDAVADARFRRELERALEHRQLRVVYQPEFELATGCLLGVEALVRWAHPDRGVIPPVEFVPLAERTGQIVDVDEYVLREAARQAAAWRASLPGDTSFWVAVNFSAHHLARDDLAQRVAMLLADEGLSPSALHVELTESAVIADVDLAIERVNELRRLGVKVAVDDFGTGQSSLAYLHRFHADVVKLDRSFVAGIADARLQALASAVVTLATDLGATTVAEGVETEEQADTVRRLGYRAAQGYYYARPSEPADVERLLPMAVADPTSRTGV